ncbi:MAG: hypothetical protein ACE5EM_01700 [Sphingomonadales bacterium]
MKSGFFRHYLLPGVVFQSVIIGGGYATGRELAAFFLPSGPGGGLLAIGVATVIWSVTLALSFELARASRSYDYRSFFKELIGPGWVLFELAYLALLLLVLSVVGAASGVVVAASFGLDPLVGTLGLLVAIGFLAFYGSGAIERFLAGWSFVLYATYIVLVVWVFVVFGDRIVGNFGQYGVGAGWFKGGVSYAGYNVAGIAAVLFCIRHLASRRQAVVAGLLAGPIAMIPGLLLFLAVVAFYPEISTQEVPLNFLVGELGAPRFLILFQIVIFGTFIETGIAMIHAINERVATEFEARKAVMPRWLRPAIAVTILILATYGATEIGLIDLIAQGYGTLTWVFVAIFLAPLFLLGMWRIRAHS